MSRTDTTLEQEVAQRSQPGGRVKLTRLLVVVLTLLVWVGLAGVGGPLVLAQPAFIVAFGVLLDTLVVRSLLVPAFDHDLGARIWWPSRLGQKVPPDSDR